MRYDLEIEHQPEMPAVCPRCAGTNFPWAAKCDHCGLPLTGSGSPDTASDDAPAAPPAADEAERIVDLEAHREQTFQASLLAATPHIVVTPALIAVNLAVFAAMVARHVSAFAPTTEALVAWGADYGPLTTHGQWWRLVTATFVHIGLTHLLVNMYALFIIGWFTERLFGNAGFLVLYLLGGIAASLTSLSIHPTIVSAGASGAIFALYGGLIGFLLVRRSAMSYGTATSLALNAAGFVAFNLFYGMTKAHIDMAAHVGGLLAGVPIGAAMAFDPATTSGAVRLWRSALVCVFGAAILVPVARRIPALDDWPREFASWMSLTRDTATRLNQLQDKTDADKALTSEQIADQIDRQLVPALDAERDRLEKLRLLPEQQAVARKAIAYLTLQADALQIAATAERTRDAALNSQASAKGDEAAEVLQSILPDPKLAAALAERKAIRASIEALSAEIKKIFDIEREQAQLYAQAVEDYRAKRIREAELATLIEQQLLPPWLAEQEALPKVQVVPAQEPLLKKFQEYMALRAEGWRLTAKGLRSGDRRLLERGNAKQKAAKQLLEPSTNR
jgi:membrane associated rhomboid family serine protease